MEKYYIALVFIGLCVSMSQGQEFCDQDVKACTEEFDHQQTLLAQTAFNFTDICNLVDDFMACVDTSLAPCDVITRNTLMSAIDQLINIYTSSPYDCELDFDDDFEYSNCSQEVTECAFYKYDAEETKDNNTEACSQFDKFVECMEQNTTNCEGAERDGITQSIQNTTDTFSRCPYACGQPTLICTTTSSSTTPLTTTATMSVFPSPSVSAMSEIDMTDYYMVSASDDFYNPSVNPSMYSSDVTPALTDDFLATDFFPYETASISDIFATATDDTTTMSTDTTTSSFTSPTTETSSLSSSTSTTAKPTEKPTVKPTEKPTTVKLNPTTTPKDTTKKADTTASTESTTTTPKQTTQSPTTPKTTKKSDTATASTTDFPTPNYDSGATLTQQSLVFLLSSLILTFLA